MYVGVQTQTVGQTVKLTTWLWAHVCSPPVCTALRARVRFLLAELRLISFRLYVSPLSIVHHGWISNSPIARSFYRRIFRYSPTVGRPARVQLSCSFANLRKGFASDRFRTIILAWFWSIDHSYFDTYYRSVFLNLWIWMDGFLFNFVSKNHFGSRFCFDRLWSIDQSLLVSRWIWFSNNIQNCCCIDRDSNMDYRSFQRILF